ncbi:IRK-interacting protein [Canna indica]|uniref:IRK-interacting protein n=1 Tax=Canna indica TaxID=4628 RepID=A0AAQ3KNU0_9LILI|nr:IRK-interacting protein [Canna indica]
MDSPTDADAGTQAHGLQREDIQAAIAKAAELRALHAALLQGGTGGSSAVARLSTGAFPPVSRGVNHHPSIPEDYPVFTPSYEEEYLPCCHYFNPENRSLSQTTSRTSMEGEGKEDTQAVVFDNTSLSNFSISNNEPKNFPSTGQLCSNHASLLQAALEPKILKSSSRTGTREHQTVMAYDTINMEVNLDRKCLKKVKSTGASMNPDKSVKVHTKHRGATLSWLFPKSKKRLNPKMSPKTMESDNMSQLLNEWGVLSLDSLKKELAEANKCKDDALAEVSEMKSSLRDLQQKLINLETYCEELKKVLKKSVNVKSCQDLDKSKLSKRMKANGSSKDYSMPVSQEVMVEGFLQIVSEARLSVREFCKTLIHLIEEANDDLAEKLSLLLQPHQTALTDKYSKGVIYHLEALINQSLYQDFENCVFQNNGSPKFLDPLKECRENFSSFVALRNLSYNEVLCKGTKCYNEDFSRFCDQKMRCIMPLLDWPSPWPERLLQCFFISAKCIWLLHLLAFSFSPPLRILRIDRDGDFDSTYMEDIPLQKQAVKLAPTQVMIMVMPGFYVQDRVLKCRVLCRCETVA